MKIQSGNDEGLSEFSEPVAFDIMRIMIGLDVWKKGPLEKSSVCSTFIFRTGSEEICRHEIRERHDEGLLGTRRISARKRVFLINIHAMFFKLDILHGNSFMLVCQVCALFP